MQTIKDWFRTVAFALNDDEPTRPFQRYQLANMIDAYNQAMCLVAQYRNDLFTELRSVRLVAGKYQDVRGCCSKVLGVLDQLDAKGNVLRELSGSRATMSSAKNNWKKPSCIGTDSVAYVIDSATIDANLDGRFSVYPPVPCGVEAFVMVKCVSVPCAIDESQANEAMPGDCGQLVAVWHYVLAMMLTGDRSDNGAITDKKFHYDMFFNILGIEQKADDRIESKEQAT